MALIPEWIEEELWNWARWCWSGPWPHPLPQDRAASAEGRYLAPSDLGDLPPPRPPKPIRERAEVVQRVYLDELNERERRVLVLRYVYRRPQDRIQRQMRISGEAVSTALIDAARRVGAAFKAEVN